MNNYDYLLIGSSSLKGKELGLGEKQVLSTAVLDSQFKISSFKDLVIYIDDKLMDDDESFSSTLHLLETQKNKIKLVLIKKEVEKKYGVLSNFYNLLPDTKIELVNDIEECKRTLKTADVESIGGYKKMETKKENEVEIATSFDPFSTEKVEPKKAEEIVDVLDDILAGLDKPAEVKTQKPSTPKFEKPVKKNNENKNKQNKKEFTKPEAKKVTETQNKKSTNHNDKIYNEWKPANNKITLVYMPDRRLSKSYKDSLDFDSHLVYIDEFKQNEYIKTVDTMCITKTIDEGTFKSLTSNGNKNVKNKHIQELFRVKNATNELDKELLIEKYKKFANKQTLLICNEESTFSDMVRYAASVELLVNNNIKDTQAALKLYNNFSSANATVKIYAGNTEVIQGKDTVLVPVFTEMRK